MTAPRFRTFVAADGSHRWTLIAGNGEPVCTSEGYTRTGDRDRAISDMMRIVTDMVTAHTWPPTSGPESPPVDHQAARQEFTRRATDRNDDGPDAA